MKISGDNPQLSFKSLKLKLMMKWARDVSRMESAGANEDFMQMICYVIFYSK